MDPWIRTSFSEFIMARISLVLTFALLTGAWSSADVRLLDAAGGLSSVGLLQVNTDAGFGTVCGANAAAADANRPPPYTYLLHLWAVPMQELQEFSHHALLAAMWCWQAR